MPHLILIRHSTTQPKAGSSAHDWQLTDEGRRKCLILAERLRPYSIHHLYSSDEPKAVQTAEQVAQELGGLPVTLDEQLRETHRKTAPYFADEIAFVQAIQSAMNRPQQLLYGEETFEAARIRFTEAINRIMVTTRGETLALVSHATIESLYIANLIDSNPYDIWKLLDMPAYVVFSLPAMRLNEICFSML
ncbi:MAG: histidine phosphatase family protein [Anaerolineae bacterium]|nr:histidine phosphatase family protein [Anaerolineae bacterium]